MVSLEERIQEIEDEIKKTPKNKGTEAHLAKLKMKLAALKELREKRTSKRSVTSQGIKKQGDATVCMVGFPSVGKSSLLNVLSNAQSKVGDYAFTTTEVVPGMMFYRGAYIQLLDLPGIIDQASSGIGMGREILSYARVADLILIVVDPTQDIEHQIKVIHKELHSAGFRLNKRKPDIKIIKKDRGGIEIFIAQGLNISKEDVREIAMDFNIHNAEIIIRDAESIEDVYDAFFSNRVYVPALYVISKSDVLSEDERKTISSYMDKLDVEYVFVSSAIGDLGELKDKMFNLLSFIRVYPKKPTLKIEDVNKEEPLILRKGATIRDVLHALKFSEETFSYARVWGKSAKFPGQRCGIEHVLEDEDIVEIIRKS